MKIRFRYDLLLFALFLLVLGLKFFSSKPATEEIIVDGIHTPKKPCVNLINEMYGSAVDSNKMCDCLIPTFYDFVKRNPSQLEKFKQIGLYVLSPDSNAKFIPLFENCLRRNLLDSNHILQFNGIYLQGLKEKLRQALDSVGTLKNYSATLVADCIADKLNGHITVAQYLSPNYFNTDRMKQIIVDCAVSIEKNR